MNLPLAFRLSWRYLRGRRSANAVPILSRISMAAIAVGCGALIVLFSVFNGFNELIDTFYTSFYADIRISPVKGKFFPLDESRQEAVKAVPGVKAVAPIIQDNVLANSEEDQLVVTLRGVDSRYFSVNDLKPYVPYGVDTVSMYPIPTALAGMGIAARLNLSVENAFSRLRLHYPNAETNNMVLNPAEAFRSLELKPDGIFSVQSEFDEKYVLAPLPLVQELFGAVGSASSLELRVDSNQLSTAQASLRKLFGPGFRVENRYEQNRTFYMVMQTEKWAVYAILLLVLLIASFNLVGALSMLVLEKQKDVAILRAMGAERSTIRSIFMLESMLWAGVGGLIGIFFGALLCLGQQRFGWIELQGSFLIKAYPVALKPGDFVWVFATALGLGLLAGWLPAMRAARVELPGLKGAE